MGLAWRFLIQIVSMSRDRKLAFSSLTDPLPFIEMGTRDKEISVSLIFYVGIKGAARTITNAAKLDRNVSKNGVLEKLRDIHDVEEYRMILQQYGLE